MPKPSYATLRARAERVRWMRYARALAACRAAGLDVVCLHNAMVDYERGRPWQGVDYSHARRAARLLASQFDATRWLSALVERRGVHAFVWSV
jgi:hypothetical protein